MKESFRYNIPNTVSQKFLQPKRSGTRLFEPVSFVCHQDKRRGVGGANIYLGFYGVLASETSYTRGYYITVKNTKLHLLKLF